MQGDFLKSVAGKPNARVLKPEYDLHEPWKAKDVRAVVSAVHGVYVETQGEDLSDEAFRERCYGRADVARFKTVHPEMFKMITDRDAMRDPARRNVIETMLAIRERVDAGLASDGPQLDAAASQAIVHGLTPAGKGEASTRASRP